jgi:hypothetical protein
MLTAEEYIQAEFDYTLAEARRGFKIHAAVYALVMTGLIALNAVLVAYGRGLPVGRVPAGGLEHRPHGPLHLRFPSRRRRDSRPADEDRGRRKATARNRVKASEQYRRGAGNLSGASRLGVLT